MIHDTAPEKGPDAIAYAVTPMTRTITNERRSPPPSLARAPKPQDTAEELTQIVKEIDVYPATLAAAWAWKHWTCPIPIIPAHSVSQLKLSLAALDCDMNDDLYERLCKLSPAPPPSTDRIEET
jgi:aryl-alcohol dehydrogenase-like predicted oxidoreductase